MPTKQNRAGNLQNYVPAGNGDAEKIPIIRSEIWQMKLIKM